MIRKGGKWRLVRGGGEPAAFSRLFGLKRIYYALAMEETEAPPTVADLYPQLTPEQAFEAEHNLERYLELALRIYERICSDPAAYAQFKNLTESRRAPKMSPETGSPSIPNNLANPA